MVSLKRRAVVTGLGVVSPAGHNASSFLQHLKTGTPGYAAIHSFSTENFPVKDAYEVKGFNGHPLGVHLLDPFIQYAVAAADEALRDAKFEPEKEDPFRIGIVVSSSKGGVHTVDRFAERFRKYPSAILGARIYCNSVPNFGAQWIARRWKLQGPAKCYVLACATGTVSILEGARMVQDGLTDYCIAGASDASITPLMLAAYSNMKVLSKGPMRPFDKRRDGFGAGEGAGVVLIETPESARARGAKIYGEVLGGALGMDGHDIVHFDPHGDTLSRTIENALKYSGVHQDEIDYINVHGTATRAGDVYETRQLKKFFQKRAAKIPMSSTKSMTGHMLGASGAVEIITSLLAMEHGFVPPTAGLEHPDPECDLDYTPVHARDAKIKTALSYSMGFGGHAVAVVLRKF